MSSISCKRTGRTLVAALLLSLALTACTDDEPTSPPGGAAGQSVPGYPGLYIDESVVSVLPGAADQLQLVGAVTCAGMDAMLSAGQWRVVDRMTIPAAMAGLSALAGVLPALLLQRDTTMAFVGFKGERDFCRATVTQVQHDGIAVTGDGFPGKAAGWAATTVCIRTSATALTISVYFDTAAKLGGLVTVPLVNDGGKYTVDGTSDDLALKVLGHPSHVLEVFGASFSTGVVPPDVAIYLPEPGEAFAGTATVDGPPERPKGSFTMTGLVDPASSKEVGVALPFACPSVLDMSAA